MSCILRGKSVASSFNGFLSVCWLLGTSVRKSGSLLQYNISLLSLSLVHICNCRENREQTFPFSVNVHADASARQQEHAVFVCYVRENAGNYLTTNSCSGTIEVVRQTGFSHPFLNALANGYATFR